MGNRLALAVMCSVVGSTAWSAIWYTEDTDPFTGKDNSAVIVQSDEGDIQGVGWKCFSTGVTIIFAHGYKGGNRQDKVSVLYKFDDNPPSSEKYYDLGSNSQHTFVSTPDVADFTRQALSSQKLIVRITDPLDGERSDASFSLTGLSTELIKLSCAGSFFN
jgi:hypothetical protein